VPGLPHCYSRAYLRHLHEQADPLYGRLATIHNLVFFHQWVGALRAALRAQRFASRRRAVFIESLPDILSGESLNRPSKRPGRPVPAAPPG
jgi:queuine/archaeosine tRNA-ribosyltransferase